MKIRHYRQIYTDRPDPIVFLPIAVSTSGRVYEDFARLLFLHAHREARFRTKSAQTVLLEQGIKQREKRVAQWVAKTLPLAKLGVWGCVQAQEQWSTSTEEDAHRGPGHHWLCEFGDTGNGTNCEKKFNLSHQKWEDYRGTRFYTGDCALVINRWLNL
jgi:hypothetical protein